MSHQLGIFRSIFHVLKLYSLVWLQNLKYGKGCLVILRPVIRSRQVTLHGKFLWWHWDFDETGPSQCLETEVLRSPQYGHCYLSQSKPWVYLPKPCSNCLSLARGTCSAVLPVSIGSLYCSVTLVYYLYTTLSNKILHISWEWNSKLRCLGLKYFSTNFKIRFTIWIWKLGCG